jgi:type III restriction enzyme
MPEVISYVKNQGLGFFIPYVKEGQEHKYVPDFIAVVDYGQEEILYLIIEVSGQNLEDKKIKVDTATKLWIPAVNNYGGFGRWEFIEVKDPWNSKNQLQEFIAKIREG